MTHETADQPDRDATRTDDTVRFAMPCALTAAEALVYAEAYEVRE